MMARSYICLYIFTSNLRQIHRDTNGHSWAGTNSGKWRILKIHTEDNFIFSKREDIPG